MPLPTLPGTHRWVDGGAVIRFAGNAVLGAGTQNIYVWDADTDLAVTDLYDQNGAACTSVPVVGNTFKAGVPTTVSHPVFSVGSTGLRFSGQDWGLLAAAAMAVNSDAQTATNVNASGSATDVALKAIYAPKTGSLEYATKPKTGKNALTGWFHADGYGLSTANTASANDTALAAAHTAMSNGDTLYIPAAATAYQFSTFTPTKAIRILGGFAHMRNQVGFGNATWASSAISSGLVAGTILQSNATSGSAVNLAANGDLNGFSVENLVIIGPGSGTSNGMTIGPAGGGGFPVRTKLRNVSVANFATGITASCENSQWDAVYIVGCSTGLATTWPFNGNTINGLNIEVTTVAALSMTSSDGNKFNGGVLQGNTGDTIFMAGCWGNELYFYVEGTAASGPTNDVHLTTDTGGTGLASCDNKIGGFWASHSTAGPRFLIDANCRRNTFHGSGPHGTVIYAVSNAGVNNNFLLYISGTITDTGRNNAYLDDGAFTGTYLPIVSSATSGQTLQVNDNLYEQTGSAMTTHLPDPTTVRPGKVLIVKNRTSNTNNVVDSAGTSKTIDGAASVTLAPWQSLRVYSNGTNWFTV